MNFLAVYSTVFFFFYLLARWVVREESITMGFMAALTHAFVLTYLPNLKNVTISFTALIQVYSIATFLLLRFIGLDIIFRDLLCDNAVYLVMIILLSVYLVFTMLIIYKLIRNFLEYGLAVSVVAENLAYVSCVAVFSGLLSPL